MARLETREKPEKRSSYGSEVLVMKNNWRCNVALLAFALILVFPPVALAQKLTVGWSAVSALNALFWVVKEAAF
jgi:hypothetical protein